MCILNNGKLVCTGHLRQVCVCLFSCLEHASGPETKMSVASVFHPPKPPLISSDKPVFTVSTKCFPGDDHTSNMPVHKEIKCKNNRNKIRNAELEARCLSSSSALFIFICFVSSHLLFSSAFQACGDPKAKPSYLVDKNLESAVKFIVRKFPAVETRNNNVSTPACMSALCLYSIERKRVCLPL